jgi:chromate transport protein ChrA
VAFALGYVRAGIGGAFAATAGFRYIPGALASSVALIIALAAFGLLQFWKWPPWLLVLLSGIAGFVFLRQ